MRNLILLSIVILILLNSCSKSIVGKTWYRGHTYSECMGTLIKADPKNRFSLFK